MKLRENKFRIGVDIDDVTSEFMIYYLKFYNRKHNTNFNLSDITNYHLWETGFHNSKEETLKEVLEFQTSSNFNEVDLIEGAKEGLNKLSENHQIYFITSRPEEIKSKTTLFFNKHFPENGFNIIYSGEIYGGKLSKSEICKNFEISFLIEDNPDYALDCAKNGIKVFLLDKPWNKNYEQHENIIKVKNWEEILEKLEIEK